MVFLFNFLRHKKVQRIIRVIVDDMVEPAHSDEAIEAALAGFKVEIWDWRKLDLCTETILAATFDAEEVCLYWSGNNAVLRGWSEAGGLPLLRKLKKVHLHVEQVSSAHAFGYCSTFDSSLGPGKQSANREQRRGFSKSFSQTPS